LGNGEKSARAPRIFARIGFVGAWGGGRAQPGSSGGIATVGYSASLELDGSGAQILTDGGASSGLSGLAVNDGSLVLEGNDSYGAGGTSLTTTPSFTNYHSVNIDTYQSAGGSAVTFGGTLTNDRTLSIGNTYLSAPTTVRATALANNGQLGIEGNTASGTLNKASLIIAGTAASIVTGDLGVGGDAVLEFGSGGITTVASGGSLELDGEAQILTDGGASSALSGLKTNDGTLTLQGESLYGTGGATLATTTGLTNNDQFSIDASAFTSEGGSAVAIGGRLTNNGTLDIGDADLVAPTTVSATALVNMGTLNLAGNAYSEGKDTASLVISGAAATTGAITVAADSEIDVTGSNSFTQAGGSTTVTGSLVASTIDADGGLLDFASVITGGDGVGALNVGAWGNLEFGAAVDSSHSVNFAAAGGTLSLGDAAAFAGTIDNFGSSDAIDLLGQAVTHLAYSGTSSSGTLTVTGLSGTIARLAFSGDYTPSSFAWASDGHGGTNILYA
jgi:hypothetical protein